MLQSLGWAALGTGFTFLMTALGAAMVFFFAGEPRPHFQKTLLGFAAGVMTAASVWSLLLPAIDRAAEGALPDWLPAAGGMLLGVVFLSALDALLPHLRRDRTWQDASWRQTTLLMTAITLHNVPEGMAVGLAFALVSGGEGFAGAAALAMGIGIQNFPEGAAVALPLRQGGWSRPRAFVGGMLSGAVEPVFGVLAALAAAGVDPLMPWLLSFAAGAMLYVVVEELIPPGPQPGGDLRFCDGIPGDDGAGRGTGRLRPPSGLRQKRAGRPPAGGLPVLRSSGLSAGLQSQNHQSGFAVPNGNAAVAVQGKTGSLLHGNDERGRAGYTGIVDTGPIVDAVLQMTASSVARCDLKISGGQKVGGKVVGDEIYSRLQEELSGRFLHNVAGHIRCCRTQRD